MGDPHTVRNATPCLMCGQPVKQPAAGRARKFHNTACRDLYRMIEGLTGTPELQKRLTEAFRRQRNEVYREGIRRQYRRSLRARADETLVSEGAE